MDLAKKTPDWIHSFSVSETRKHKGYTIYRITSIVFPRYLPEALSSVTLWKRFSDVKQLYKDLVKRHRERHLPGTVPALAERTYFKRFDARVIEERRQYILKLLEFAGGEPLLYQSYAFVKFFERGISPEGSPQKGGGNIAEICENLAIPVPEEIVLIDPSREDDADGRSGSEQDDDLSIGTGHGSLVDSMLSQSSSDPPPVATGPAAVVHEANDADEVDSLDYIVEAAMVFSRAAQAEANGRYKEAFDGYKEGIDRLLTGAKTDGNAGRKKMAKEKTCKYVTRAEEIYEKYLLHQEDDGGILQLSPICLDDPSSPIQLLERPLNYLSRYKVVRVLEGRVMQVQDVTDRKFYVMKGIRKPVGGFSQASSLPYNVPYMVPLVAYFQSESSVFLLLKLVAGGKLWDYIASYRKSDEFVVVTDDSPTERDDCDEQEAKTQESSNESDSSIATTTGFDSGFVDLVNDYNSKQPEPQEDPVPSEEVEQAEEAVVDEVDHTPTNYIPSFDALSKDMDVSDLVSCSQQLLRAVSETIEQSHQQIRRPTREGDDACSEKESSRLIPAKLPKRPHIDASQLELGTTGTSATAHSSPARAPLLSDALPEGCIKQWISELIIALDNLHFNEIICGDLTMDNLLLGPEGQLMLTYFYRKERFPDAATLATELRPEAIQQLYVAPERPLQPKSDYWSVGVILFEMLTRRSFLSCHPAGVFCYCEVQFPDEAQVVISDEARVLLDGLLQPLPENRFDFKEIIASAFFHTVDWSEVKRRGQQY